MQMQQLEKNQTSQQVWLSSTLGQQLLAREQAMFVDASLEVIPAPTLFLSQYQLTPLSCLPSAEGRQRSAYALHEWLCKL